MAELAARKKQFAIGLLFAALPVGVWVFIPAVFFTKLALIMSVDDRLVSVYAFMLGCAAQVAAVLFFNRAYRRPWDWLSASAFFTAFFSSVATFIFFGAAVAVAMQGW